MFLGVVGRLASIVRNARARELQIVEYPTGSTASPLAIFASINSACVARTAARRIVCFKGSSVMALKPPNAWLNSITRSRMRRPIAVLASPVMKGLPLVTRLRLCELISLVEPGTNDLQPIYLP